jgi:asparagine synthase (glutamine-hydrolysing)
MSGIAVELSFEHSSVDGAIVSSLLEAMPHRGPDGRAVVQDGCCAMGIARRRTTTGTISALDPFRESRLGVSVVGDVRLDNRDDLATELVGTARGPIQPMELLALGYEKWGVQLAAHLEGDFAFVLWDSTRHTLYAARDPFGTRPLFYHRNRARLILCSEVDALLRQSGVEWALDDRTILDYLLGEYRHYRETFFRDIQRVIPGHYLLAKANNVSEVCYWHPPSQLAELSDQDCVGRFRELFKRSVQARLSSDMPIVAQLSGGLDSSSAACMAGEICREHPSMPRVVLASATYPGFDCDETPWIDAVAQSLPFQSIKWDARSAVWPLDVGTVLAHPWRDAQAGGGSRAFEIAREMGGRVLLSGHGGDELLFERGVFQDLAAQHRWRALVRETLLAPSFYSSRTRSFFFFEAVRPVVARPALRRAYRWFRPRPATAAPQWLGKRLQDLWSEPRPPSPFDGQGSSRAQQSNWQWLTSAEAFWSMELQELDAARMGIEMRFPYLDRAVALFVLSLPCERRLPKGQMKQILRRAMSGVLPRVVAERGQVTSFSASYCDKVRQNLTQVEATFDGSNWRCEPYVQRQRAGDLLAAVRTQTGDNDNWREWMRVWDIAILEHWLDALTRAKRERMSKSLPAPSGTASESSEERSRQNGSPKPYEPPRIERLGNLRELLAKSGAAVDAPGPHPRRT